MVASFRCAGAMVIGAVCAMPAAAQKHFSTAWAITGARIVPVSGPVIDKGTVVIRNGVIAAVGANVTAPADARLVDGTGLTVYPGLIDAYGALGQAGATAAAAANNANAAAGRGGRGAAGATATQARAEAAANSNYVSGLRPEVNVVDELDVGDNEFDGPHAAGITAALTAVGNGIFRGQAAVINLVGDSASMMVVKSGVAQSIGFARGGGGGFGGGGRGGYPGSLMGAFAALRQEFLDAQHYHDVQAAYQRNPRSGRERPTYDASLEALQPVLARQEPVIMQASTEREIIRALDLAKEFNFKPIIAGGTEAYKVADRLKAENAPVLLSLNFPRAGATGGGAGFGGGRGGGGGDPADPEPIRMLRERVMAPKNPAMLAKAGVKFAFESGTGYADMLTNMRKSVTAGLPADQAIRALTIEPAELFGVADRMGTIETGKIANLTISKGDLTEADSRITQLFIDGKPVTVAAAATGNTGNGGGRGNRPGLDATGAWTAIVHIDGKDHQVTLHIWQDDNRLFGEIQGDLGAAELTDGYIDVQGNFHFYATLSLRGGTADTEFDGSLSAQGIRASLSAEDHQGTLATTRN